MKYKISIMPNEIILSWYNETYNIEILFVPKILKVMLAKSKIKYKHLIMPQYIFFRFGSNIISIFEFLFW